MWFYRTSRGTFWIRFVPLGPGVYLLGVDDRELGTYRSPEAAADDVSLQKTGFSEWDSSEDVSPPENIAGWTRLDCADWDRSKTDGDK